MVKRITLLPPLFFLLLSGVLIFSWFRFGHIYGGGDTGLPTYNPQVMAKISGNIWWDSLSPGIPVAQGLTSAPMLYLLSIPQTLGANPVFIQAFLFFVLLFMMGYGMYLLALSIFGKDQFLLAISSGVFYLFNPYMMIQIWHRFIHNSMFVVAFLPYLVMTWLLWIRKRHPLYLLLFLLTNFLAVYIFGTIAFIVAIWTLLILLTLLEVVVPWKGKKVALKLSLAFSVGLLLWLLTNSWWLVPTFNVTPPLFAQQHTTDDSLSTLMELSSQTILPYTLRLINPFYLYWNADWGKIYQSIPFQIISWLFVLIVFTGFLKALKEKAYVSWSLLALVVIYLSKGAAPPFSFPYIFSFSHFFPLGVIRNPFEKLGILLPLIFAILFALGLQLILTVSIKYIGKSKTYLSLAVFIVLHMAFFWPMFAGKVFGTLDKQMFVEVPKSYTQADDWIRKDLGNTTPGEGRILHLPLPRSEDATYNWQYGYHGVEPSAAIFTSLPSIARGLNVPQVDDALSGLSLIFHKPYSANQAVILKMLQDFNVKYILLHKDIEWLGGELYNPEETESTLNKLEFLSKETKFGDLMIYKLKDNYFRPKVVISDNVQLLNPSKKNLFWPWMVATPSAEMVSAVSGELDNTIVARVNKIIVLPEKSSVVKNVEVPKFKGNLDNFNTIRILPTSFFHFLIEIKEGLSLIDKSRAEQQQWRIIFAEKRLVEAYRIKRMLELGIIDQKVGDRLIISSIKKYKSLLNDIFKGELMSNNVIIGNQQYGILDVFLKHISLLEEFDKSSDDIILQIFENLTKSGLSPKYPYIDEGGLVKDYRQQYTFNIPLESTYELLMNGSYVKSIYPNLLSELTFQINETYQKFKEEDKGSLMAFGKNEMEEGKYQISTQRLSSINLTPRINEWSKLGNVTISEPAGTIEMSSGTTSFSYVEGDIKPAYGGDAYLFGFDLKVLSGKGIRVQVIQDSDRVDKKSNEIASRYNNYYVPANFDSSGWNHFEAIINLQSTTQKARLRIQVEPWDDCLVVLGNKKKCSEEKVRQQYNRPSKFLIKDINAARLLNNEIFLSASLPGSPSSISSGTVLEVNRKSPSQYFGKVRITRPTFIFFKESFNPGWELKLMKNKHIDQPRQHLVGNLFANAWLVEKVGDYEFTLSYGSEKFIKVGILLASLGWAIIALLFVIRFIFKRLSFTK